MTAQEKQEREIAINAKRAKSTTAYNNTISDIINSRFSKRAFDKRRQFEKEKREGDVFVGGYVGSQITKIMENRANVQPTESVHQNIHPLIQQVYDAIPAETLEKNDARKLKNFELVLSDSDDLKLSLKIVRVTSKSLICEITSITKKTYHRFASEEDKTVVQDVKEITETHKESAKLFEPRRSMLRIVDRLICKYRITSKQTSEPWSNLLD